jgi:hypothetical protein
LGGDRGEQKVSEFFRNVFYQDVIGNFTREIRVKDKSRPKGRLFVVGGAREDRTPDLLNAIQALSHLSYDPTGPFGRRSFVALGCACL